MQRIGSAKDGLSYLTSGGGDGLAMPLGNEDVATPVREATSFTWWAATSIVLCIGLLLHSGIDVPWFVALILVAEFLVSVRRLGGQLSWWSDGQPRKNVEQRQRLRHFMSVRLHPDAPIDEIVAAFLSLDQLEGVKSVELGTNCSREGKSREHMLGFLLTFKGRQQLKAFLTSSERAAFLSSIEPYVSDDFVFDFESGVVG
uniref:Stress-response A/B barrel domain-containing protein n=1 Tax=Prymnesium polylepis TaxID=72548 RepID=A0A6V4VW48_9EUKA|mmetsp:Transcript_24516/g.60915  ORF Transcript_24516/g.60915 Transcript_24516/m.60915 type:complete len:201 (+) Transcript_24516:65-667(+)